jgi:hypothetical protein
MIQKAAQMTMIAPMIFSSMSVPPRGVITG